ncbi:TPA: phosphate starvation-inducible protein PhoH [Klebsiella pneumoniae]|uniref:Phosphate starvation-inducible protein PhoH n=2 Tax=Klebsiella pneumoniae TaxID=573 RepID=A0A6G4SAE9_KLEPN|nr:phosphate starvation-inducible protein PhoH [Klebsiella pneumoniae]THH95982.1 phosphate starvation-inducible protein PhoH [Klebsiella pneumoniae subsp. pneumoniae]NGN12135.1 phosphate starvation-inducible protein PhoH [Klebsiella pneumoniae]NGN22882.1 phosphate starvation-inducible protein PhoH [Klebsiella pneumoniae]NGN34573.1 phosphate starvation-inducible protein PhoH [Klebsiella pneumoniae]
MTNLFFVVIVLTVTHLKGLNMGNKRKQARRAARQALKSKSRILGYEIDTIIVDELASAAPALPPKPKRDTSPIEARNEAQAHYLISLDNKSLTFATGEAGCGKTFLATAVAAQRLLDKEVERIIVTRPVLQAEEDLGFLPGDMAEKFAPFFRPVYDVLQKRLGASFLEYCLKPEVAKVEIAPFAYMRGRTFENAVVILDEAQNVTASQMKMFLTRMGENVTVIVNGDITQCDLPGHVKSGLEDALQRFQPSRQVGLIKFTAEDCVRSELCKVALQAYL